MRALALAVVVGTLAVLCPSASSAVVASAESEAFLYTPAVDAEIDRHFSPPAHRFGPGNRGIKYATDPGEPVRAMAPGQVRFAGQVGGLLHVTIEHPDQRLSSYSALGAIEVRLGQYVDQGELIAMAGELTHVGVRENGEYIDPASLIDSAVSVRLIPESPVVPQSQWRTPGEERAALMAIAVELSSGGGGLLSGIGGLVRGAVGGVAAVGEWAFDSALGLAHLQVDLMQHVGGAVLGALPVAFSIAWYLAPYVAARYHPLAAGVVFGIVVPLLQGEMPPLIGFALDLGGTPLRIVRRGYEWWQHRSNCTPGDVARPPADGDRVAVLVAGLDSTSDGAAIGDLRTDELGYDPDEVIGFSYAGGRTPGLFGADDGQDQPDGSESAGSFEAVPARPYSRSDSSTDIDQSGVLLADLLVEIAATDPHATVDLYAHSQGGLVVRLAIDELTRRPGGQDVIDRLGLVATMGTPHTGSDLAAISVVMSGSLDLSAGLRAAGSITEMSLHPRGTNVDDLARWSDLTETLADQELPEGPNYLTLANRGDVVVTDARSRIDGVDHVTLNAMSPSAHATLPGQSDTTRELALALAELPPTCQGLGDFIGDVVVTETIQSAITGFGLGMSVHTLPISPLDVLEPLVRW